MPYWEIDGTCYHVTTRNLGKVLSEVLENIAYLYDETDEDPKHFYQLQEIKELLIGSRVYPLLNNFFKCPNALGQAEYIDIHAIHDWIEGPDDLIELVWTYLRECQLSMANKIRSRYIDKKKGALQAT